MIAGYQHLKKDILDTIKTLLDKRGAKARDEHTDNKVFSPFNDSLQLFINSGNLFDSLLNRYFFRFGKDGVNLRGQQEYASS